MKLNNYIRNMLRIYDLHKLSTEANLESDSRTRLDHKTLGKFKPKLTRQQSTTAIFAVLNSFIIKRLSTMSKDDKSDLCLCTSG